MGIGGSVVECSPATRAARVRFPANANNFYLYCYFPLFQFSPSHCKLKIYTAILTIIISGILHHERV